MKAKQIIILTFLAVLFICNGITNLTSATQDDIKDLLSEIALYKYGQDREPLSKFADVVRDAMNSGQGIDRLEEDILEFLKSDATLDSKEFICEQLSLFASGKSIKTLVDLLLDKKTTNSARYALERINDPSVNKALGNVLKTRNIVDPEIIIGVINTLANRKDSDASILLGGLTKNENLLISESAVAALGKIGDENASGILLKIISDKESPLRDLAADSYLLCADQFAAEGRLQDALTSYENVLDMNIAQQLNFAAVVGIMKYSGEGRVEKIKEILSGNAEMLKPIAASFISQLERPEDIREIGEILPTLSNENQVQILSAFEAFGFEEIRTLALKALENNSDQVKVAALNVIKLVGNSSDIGLLAAMASNNSGDVQEAARDCLSGLRGDEVDEKITDLLEKSNPPSQVELIKALGARYTSSAFEDVYEAAESENRAVRLEAYKTLEMISEPEDLDDLIELLLNTKNESERKPIETTITKTALKIKDKEVRADLFIAEISKEKNKEVEGSLLRIMGTTGSSKALIHLTDALKSSDPDLQRIAIGSLSNWPGGEPVSDLLEYAEGTPDETLQVLAIRSLVNILKNNPDIQKEIKFDSYERSMNLAKSDNEKRLILSGLGDVYTLPAMNFAAGFLKNQNLRQEAEIALLKIAERIGGDYPAETKENLKILLAGTNDKDIQEYAEEILSEIK